MKLPLILAPVLVGAVLGGGVAKSTVTPGRAAPSASTLRASVETALEHRDFSAAVRTTEAAYRRATRDGRWEPLIEVGDAYYRIASRPGAPETASQARDAYQAALRSARRAGSLDGVLRAAEGFAQLGDADEMEWTLHLARDLAGSDPEAIDDVRAAAGRLSDLLDVARAEPRLDD